MTHPSRWFALAVLAAGLLVRPAGAAPITQIDGNYSSVAGGDRQTNVRSFTLQNGTAVLQPDAMSGFTAGDLNIDISNFTTATAQVDFGTSLLRIGRGSQEGVFTITSPGTVVSFNNLTDPLDATFRTTVGLQSSTNLDLSGFTSGLLEVTVRYIEITPGDQEDPTGDGEFPGPFGGLLPLDLGGRADVLPLRNPLTDVRATFRIIPLALPVPEPGTLLLFGVAGAFAAARWARRRS